MSLPVLNLNKKVESTATIQQIDIYKDDGWITMDVMCDICKNVKTHAIGYMTDDNPVTTTINFSKIDDTRCCDDLYFSPSCEVIRCNSEYNFSNIKLPKPKKDDKIN